MPYLEEARPQIVQIGNYGAMFHGYAGNPKFTGWPMPLPVSGEKAALAYQNELNALVDEGEFPRPKVQEITGRSEANCTELIRKGLKEGLINTPSPRGFTQITLPAKP